MKKKMNKVFVVCLAATAMTAGMSIMSFANVKLTKAGSAAGVEYETFDEAMAQFSDGDTIELLSDSSTENGIGLAGSQLTINGNGHTLTANTKGIYIAKASKPGELTFNNCTVEIDPNEGTPTVMGEGYSWAAVVINFNCVLNFNDSKVFMNTKHPTAPNTGIYYHEGSKVNLRNTEMEVGNYTGNGFSADVNDNGKKYTSELNILEKSKLTVSKCRGGITAAMQITVNDATLINSRNRGNASNGADYILENAIVDISENGAHGMSARNITIKDNSSVDCNKNNYYGVTFYGKMSMDGTSAWNINENSQKETSGGMRAQKSFSAGTVESGAKITMNGNKGNALENYGTMTFKKNVDLEILENSEKNNGGGIYNKGTIELPASAYICNNHAGKYGGGIYNMGNAKVFSGANIYNNHAENGADDIYNGESATLKFGNTNKEWILDDCNHAIDGWYDDTEGSRWNADGGESEHHIVLVNSGSKTGMLQIKAAHGLDADDKESRPDIDKKADGEDEIKGVKPGDNISFTLESHLPARLAGFVVRSDSNAERLYIPEKFSERMIFHDKMSKNLEFDKATLKVTVGNEERVLPEEYYKVETGKGDETFRVSIALIAAFNDGYITYDELKNAEPVIVSYDAAVSDKAIDGDKVENRAWVNDSEEDIVDGPVIDPDVPSTGGIGTKAFTAAGIALMGAAAGAVIVTGKKKKKEQ